MEIVKNSTYRANIIDINSQGQGVAKINGFTVFISGALLNEEITFKAIKVNKSFAYGKLLEIHQSSPNRIDLGENEKLIRQIMPLAHMDYRSQLIFKENQVRQSFSKIGKFKEFTIEKCIGMDNPIHYRNKAQVPVGENDGSLITGIFRRRSHDIISTDNLYINHLEIDRLVSQIREILNKYKIKAYNEETHIGNIRHIIVRRGYHSGEIMIILVTKG